MLRSQSTKNRCQGQIIRNGNGGARRFVAGQGTDTVGDFNRREGDVLDLQGQTVLSLSAASGGATTLALSGGGSIVLLGVTADEFALAA